MKEFNQVITIGIIIGFILCGVELVFDFAGGQPIRINQDLLISFGLYCMYSIPISLVNSYFFRYMNRNIVWNKSNQRYRIFIGVVGSVFLTLVTVFFVRMMDLVGIKGMTYAAFIESQTASFYLQVLIVTSFFSVFFHALYFYRELQKKKVKEQKIIAGTASAQFDALKNQLDPHFLFN
ncbi:MAG: histidine kinase, partial [Bacteroidota bacterium]